MSTRYADNSADFFNTGDFGGGNNNNNTNNFNNNNMPPPPAPTRNTFSFEDTTNSGNMNNNNNNMHQRKFSSSTSTNNFGGGGALPSHARNRSGGTGGSGNTPTMTSINFGNSGSNTPPTNYNNKNSNNNNLGFANTASFLSGTNSNGGAAGDGSFDFGGRTLSNNGNNFSSDITLGRGTPSNSMGADGFDEENEPPLLEELGIRPDHIRDKVKLVLNPFAQVTSSHELCMDEDLAGPLTFVICLGFLLTLQGKVHFGAIYGTSVVGMLLSYFILSMMSQQVPVRTTLVVSTLGYCLLPDLLLAIFVTLHLVFVGGGSVGVFLPILSFVSCAWSSWCAMKIFAEAFQLHHVRYLILYPAFLFYATFAAITMF